MNQTTTKKSLQILLAVDILLIVLEIVGVVFAVQRFGIHLFRYYTQDSNLFMLGAAALEAVYLVRLLRHGTAIPRLAMRLRFGATCCVTVTFLVVLFILAPTMGGTIVQNYAKSFLPGAMLYHHLLCPLLAIFSFVLLGRIEGLAAKDIRFAVVPTVCYAAVTLALNLLRLLDGPYPFLRVYNQPVWMSCLWCVLILGGAAAISRGLLALAQHFARQ